MEIKFLDNLIHEIDSYTLSDLPHSILLSGDYGSGKHLLCKYIADKFNLEIRDITDSLTYETLEEINLSGRIYLCMIDLTNPTTKDMNTILKFVEEPQVNIYNVLLCKDGNVIETVKNRCITFNIKKYTVDELKTFTDKNCDFEIFDTPGKVIDFNVNVDFDRVFKLADNIVMNIGRANYANILTIPKNIGFAKDDIDKCNIDIFMRILSKRFLRKYFNDKDLKYRDAYIVTNKYFNDISLPHVDKQRLFEKYLFELKGVLR